MLELAPLVADFRGRRNGAKRSDAVHATHFLQTRREDGARLPWHMRAHAAAREPVLSAESRRAATAAVREYLAELGQFDRLHDVIVEARLERPLTIRFLAVARDGDEIGTGAGVE